MSTMPPLESITNYSTSPASSPDSGGGKRRSVSASVVAQARKKAAAAEMGIPDERDQ
jgi:hypothetical protein